jgi:hypothetical protein
MTRLAQSHILTVALLSVGLLGACSNKESLGSTSRGDQSAIMRPSTTHLPVRGLIDKEPER